MKTFRFALVFSLFLGGLLVGSCDPEQWEELSSKKEFIDITSISPHRNLTNVNQATSIVINFSQSIKSSTFIRAFKLEADSGVVPLSNYTVTWTNNNQTVTLSNPVTNLATQTIYNLSISTNLRSASNNPLEYSYSSTFVTGGAVITYPATGFYGSNLLSKTSIVGTELTTVCLVLE
ncbi:MAG: Ig-like domain-containing protein [Spirochaetota bacterium]|nr:Ig-like domain-containing protein [Spirochaetota bacterium]